MRLLVALTILLLVPVAASAQQTTVVRAARWLDVAAGQIRTPALVTIQDGRIASVGGAAPAGAQVIDLGDVTLLPGLIDAHTHLTLDIEGNWVMRTNASDLVGGDDRGVIAAGKLADLIAVPGETPSRTSR